MDKNNQSKGTFVMLGLLAMVVLLLLVIYNTQKRFENSIKPAISAEPIVNESTSTPDTTKIIQGPANYTNAAFGFGFTIPKDIKVSEFEQGAIIDLASKNRIVFYVSPDNSDTIADYLSKVDEISKSSYEGLPSVQVQSTSKTVINGLNCIQRKEYVHAADLVQTATYFKNGPTVVSVVFEPVPGNETEKDMAIYTEILNTFSFTK